MARKSKTISCRVSAETLKWIDEKCKQLNMSRTDYIEMKLKDDTVTCMPHTQDLVRCLCNIQIALEKNGLKDYAITKEVANICQLFLQ